MALVLTEEQSMLRDSARGLISDKAPVSHLRGLRDSKDATGFSRDLWKAFAAVAERAVDLVKAGQSHPAFSSAMKYYGTELNKRRHEILMSAGGVDALEWESERSRQGARPRAWLRTKANSIEGGTSEVMLGIVAKSILDLPGA